MEYALQITYQYVTNQSTTFKVDSINKLLNTDWANNNAMHALHANQDKSLLITDVLQEYHANASSNTMLQQILALIADKANLLLV